MREIHVILRQQKTSENISFLYCNFLILTMKVSVKDLQLYRLESDPKVVSSLPRTLCSNQIPSFSLVHLLHPAWLARLPLSWAVSARPAHHQHQTHPGHVCQTESYHGCWCSWCCRYLHLLHLFFLGWSNLLLGQGRAVWGQGGEGSPLCPCQHSPVRKDCTRKLFFLLPSHKIHPYYYC